MRGLVRSVLLCAGAVGGGLWLDGPTAWIALQALCTGASFYPQDIVLFHLFAAPFTSLTMAALVLLYHFPRITATKSLGLVEMMLGVWSALRVFALMTAAMMAGQLVAIAVKNTPQAMAAGAIAGASAITVFIYMFRLSLIRLHDIEEQRELK